MYFKAIEVEKKENKYTKEKDDSSGIQRIIELCPNKM